MVRAGAGETWCILLGSHIENLRAGEQSCWVTRDLSPQKNPTEREGKTKDRQETWHSSHCTLPHSPWKKLEVVWWALLWFDDFLRFVSLDKECAGGEEKQVTHREIFTGDDGAISETDIFSPVNPGTPRAFSFHPSCLTTLPKWGFPSPFQLFLFSGSRKTNHTCKPCHFLKLYTKTSQNDVSLCLWSPQSHILMLSSEGTLRIQCGDSPIYVIYLLINLFNIFLHCAVQPICLLCWGGWPHDDWMHRNVETLVWFEPGSKPGFCTPHKLRRWSSHSLQPLWKLLLSPKCSYLGGKQTNFLVSSGSKEMEKKEGHQEGTNL